MQPHGHAPPSGVGYGRDVHPIVRASLAVAALSTVSASAGLASKPRVVTIVRSVGGAASDGALSSVCPAGSLPDSTQCVPFPDVAPEDQAPGLYGSIAAHRDRGGQWLIYEQIPRRPDRPAAYDAYTYPIARWDAGPLVLSGYDLHRPDHEQRRSNALPDVGHGGVDLAQERGAPVRVINLEHQRGEAEVVFVGALFGTTVVTRHTLNEAGHTRDYLLIHGHLDAAAPGLGPGAVVKEGNLLGFVGDSGSEGRVHLHLEVRQIRDAIDAAAIRSSALADRTVSIACDPRNVLPLK